MTARTSPERLVQRAPARVAVLDDRTLLASGLRSMLANVRGIDCVAADDLQPGDFAVVGMCAEPYTPPPGIRVLELNVERSLVDLARSIVTDAVPRRRSRQGHALSEQEQTILTMTAEGSSATQIARRLGVSARTIERHRQSVTEKLAVRSSSHAVAVGALGDDARTG